MPLVSPAAAAAYLPCRVSRATIWRWMSQGVGGRRLAYSKIGGRRLIDTSDLAAFVRVGGAAASLEVRRAVANDGLRRYGFYQQEDCRG